MPFAGEWCKVWIYFGFVFAWTKGARPRFDTSTDMGLVLIPADAEVDSVIFRLRATDQDADFPLVFEITATITPVVRIDNLPCTLYNKVCQANVILTKRLVPGRLHDFAVRVRDTKGDSNSMQATISVTNATTPRDKIFPHIPSLIMVPEDTKPGKELDYLLVRANSWSGKPVYIELWQPKELFTIRQRQTPTQTRGVITLIGELDFETQSMYTLTMYATDPYTESGKDTRNIAGLSVIVIVQDVQDVPPIFTLAPPLTRINNSVQPGDIILRVHAEDGDKGVPREIVYGLVSEGNPFTPFFNISEASGEIVLARPLEELTQITHVGAPVVLTVVAEEVRRSREEPPAQATVVDVGFLLGEPGNSPPYFESDNYVATIDENPEPGTLINFGEQYLMKVKDEDIGKAGVFALKLENNNGTFEINPTVAERTADFVISVRDNTLIDYELYQDLSFKIVAQEVGPATNLSAAVPVIIHLRDVNDNPPVFEEEAYEVTLSENVTAGSRVVQVHATDRDTGVYGSIRYTNITGEGSEAFTMEPDTGLITVAMGSTLDREIAAKLVLSIEARDENGNGNRGVVPLIVNLLDVNDNAPVFEKDTYEFMLNADLTNFTSPAFIKAIDGDAEPPNNVVRYELIHGNYENKFYLNETSGELTLRSPISKIRRKKQSVTDKFSKAAAKNFVTTTDNKLNVITHLNENETSVYSKNRINPMNLTRDIMKEIVKKRRKRAEDDALYTLTARAYDLGVPHLSSVTKIRITSGATMEARIMMFVVPGEQPDSTKTAETLAAITGGRVTVLETRPYIQQNRTGSAGAIPDGGKKSIIVARVEQTEAGTSLVDVEKIREALAANGVGIIGGTDNIMNTTTHVNNTVVAPVNVTSRSTIHDGQTIITNNTFATVHNEEVTVYKAENKLLFWLLIILGLLMLIAIAVLIVCCICPGCPFYMAPRKRRVHSSETLVVRTDGRPRRHLHRQPATIAEVSWNGRKQAWSADPTRRNWQFNKRNVKNCSLPGDVAYISGQPNNVHVYLNTDAQRLRDGPSYGHSRRSRMNEEDRMYMEDVEGQKGRGYDTAEMESLHQHEMERGSDLQREAYRQRYIEPEIHDAPAVREQHFFREGNAEVLRLVTRGQVEDTTTTQVHHQRATTLIVDGKDIILQRFIEDQNSRQELPMQDAEAPRSMESHHRGKETFQQPQPPEVILIPDRLDLGHRQHIEEIGPNVQRLVIDHGDYDSQKMEKELQMRDSLRQDKQENAAGEISVTDKPTGAITKEHIQTSNAQYSLHDIELARQNALLTRLLLDREHRRVAGGGGMDSTSYLETQSLPGQVAIATQTDRSAATQTDRQVRSRSDNDESDEESGHKKKLKSRKKHGDGDWRRGRTLWMKSPIEEEGSPRFDKRLSILRKKVKEAKESRQGSLEPEVLREISDSLDGNGSSNKGDDDGTARRYRKTAEQATSISYKMLNQNESQSSEERQKGKLRKSCEDMTDDQKTNATESTSSPEIKIKRQRHSYEKIPEKSPQKDRKSKVQKKSERAIKPGLKILEKEFTILTKKLSKLGERKCQESTGSDSTSQEKSEGLSKDARTELEQKNLKKMDSSSSQKQTVEGTTSTSKMEQKGKQKKEITLTKGKQKLKYQQTQVMSTGSSEVEDALERSKKVAGPRQESVKQKGHLKLKRVVQGDRKDGKKQLQDMRDEDIEKRKDTVSKEMSNIEGMQEKVEKEKMTMRAAKLATLSRGGVIDEGSIEEKKDRKRVPTLVDVMDERESNTEFSERESSNGWQQRGILEKKVVQGFSDDFVEQADDIEEKTMVSREEATEDRITEEDQSMEEKGSIQAAEDMSTKKITDDSAYLKSRQELITGRSINNGILMKDEKFMDDSKTQEERIIISPISGKKRMKTLELNKHEDADVKSDDIVKSKQNGEKETKVKRNEQKDIETSESKNGVAKPEEEQKVKSQPPENIKQKTESKHEEELLQKRKQTDTELDTLHTQHVVDKISKDFETKSESIDPLKEVRVAREVEQIQEKSSVLDHVNGVVDKSDAVQEANTRPAMEIFTGDTSNGKTDTVKTIEEYIEEDRKIVSQSDDQNGILQESIDKSKTHEIASTTYQADKQEDKLSLDPPMHQIVEEKEKHGSRQIKVDVHVIPLDSDKVEGFPEQEATSKIRSDELGTMESVLPKEEKQYHEPQDESEKFINQDDISKNAVLIGSIEITDKEQTAIENIRADKTIEGISYQKITEDTINNTKSLGETIQDHKTVEQLSEDHQSVGEKIGDSRSIDVLDESDKILEQPVADHKIVEELITDLRDVSELSSKDIKSVEKNLSEDHKIDKQLTEDHELVEKPTEDRKIIEQPIENHEMVVEVTESEKSVEKLTDDHTTIEQLTETSKIDKKSIEDYEIVKEPTKDIDVLETIIESPKVIEESTESHTIMEQSTQEDKTVNGTAKGPENKELTEDYAIGEKSTKGHTISENLIEDRKIIEASTDTEKEIAVDTNIEKIVGEEAIDSKIPEESIEIYEVTEPTTMDSKDIIETIIPTVQEKLDNANEKHFTDFGDEQMKYNENVIIDTKEVSHEQTAAIKKTIVDDEETSKKQTTTLDQTKEIIDIGYDGNNKKEAKAGTVSSEQPAIDEISRDESKVDTIVYFNGTEKVPASNIVQEPTTEGQNDISEEKVKAVAIKTRDSDGDVKAETIQTSVESDNIKIMDKMISIEAQEPVDGKTCEKFIAPETLIAEQEKIIIEQEKVLPTILDQSSSKDDVFSVISDINKDNFTRIEESTPEMPTIAKEAGEKPNITSKADSPTLENVKEETIDSTETDQTSENGSVLSHMFKSVHSLVDKLTSSLETETETQVLEKQPDDDKITEKIIPPVDPDDKNKNVAIISFPDEKPTLPTTDESVMTTKSEVSIEEIKEAEDAENITGLSDDIISRSSKDTTIEDPKSTIVLEADIKADNDLSKHETEKQSPQKFIEKTEPITDKSLNNESALATNKIIDKGTEQQDIAEDLSKKALEADTETKTVSSDERKDAKLAGAVENKEQELSSKEKSSVQGSELPPPCPQTSETTQEEKFALDSIISESPIDSGKISGSEEQLMPASEQTGLQELEQFAEEQTFHPVGDEIRALPGERPHTKTDAHLTASEESVEQDLATVKLDETVHLMADMAKEGKGEMAIVGQYGDVSIPVFSSLIDAMDDSDDSDSSSDVSRKTTLTTRPYQTPRHRARELSQKEDAQTMESSDGQDIPDTMGEAFGSLDDTEPLKEDKSNEQIDKARVQQSLPREYLDKQIPLAQHKLVAAADMGSSSEEKRMKSKNGSDADAKRSFTTKRWQDKKLGSEPKQPDKISGKNGTSSTGKVTKTDTFKVIDGRMKDRVVPQPKKKVSSEESSEEKAVHPQDVTSQARYRTRKKPSTEQTRRKESDQTKQSRKADEEPRRKQSLSKSRSEKDKKSSSGSEKHLSPPKTSEIDTSKAQPKYMAWYKKNREEMEKKRAEMMATDDEEQLPRWLRRSMKTQKSEKEDKKAATGQRTTGDATPRSKRKVKPLVNVESEQLKAIVRQGRMLRKAEGGQNEDPPIQIFATSPPALPQADPKHRLMQHSEYKYEKIPGPFYLHPPPAPHPSPEMSPEHFDIRQTAEHVAAVEDFDPSIAVSLQGGNRLRHQQLLEKKSVFDIAYSEAAPSQLRSDSTTPPS